METKNFGRSNDWFNKTKKNNLPPVDYSSQYEDSKANELDFSWLEDENNEPLIPFYMTSIHSFENDVMQITPTTDHFDNN